MWWKLLLSWNEKDNIIFDIGKWFWIICLRCKYEEDIIFLYWVVGKWFCRLFFLWLCVVYLIMNWNDVFISYFELFWGFFLEYFGCFVMVCIFYWKLEYFKFCDGLWNFINLLDLCGKCVLYEMLLFLVIFICFVNLNCFIFIFWLIVEGYEK